MTVPGDLLVADVGGTHARFSWADRQGLVGETARLRTSDFEDSETLVAEALSQLPRKQPCFAGIAMAGPVAAGRGQLTNSVLGFDQEVLTAQLGCPVMVVNDFYAVARSLPELTHLRKFGGGDPGSGVKAVLGPGSGLGMGVLVPVNGRWRVVPSEGGHADLAPGSPLELEILGILQAVHGHVSWETAVSGPGLVRLYVAVSQVWGVEPEELRAEEISARGVTAEDPVCHQTLEVFLSLLGSAAGNLAVTVYALGGVYLAGGILPDLTDFLGGSPMRRRFEERGRMSELVRGIPLYLIEDPAPGMSGVLASVVDALEAD